MALEKVFEGLRGIKGLVLYARDLSRGDFVIAKVLYSLKKEITVGDRLYRLGKPLFYMNGLPVWVVSRVPLSLELQEWDKIEDKIIGKLKVLEADEWKSVLDGWAFARLNRSRALTIKDTVLIIVYSIMLISLTLLVSGVIS